MSNKRLYTEKEISAILKRSGELQSKRGDLPSQGLSIDELQQIAREVGIDPDLVTEAATELERTGGVKERRRLAGMPIELAVERVVSGEITDAQWSDIAAEIGDAFGLVGSSSQVGRMMQWTHTGRRTSQLQVTLTPRDGQTKIRIHGNYKHRVLATLIPLSLMGLMQGLVVPLSQGLPVFAAVGISVAIVGAIYLLVMMGLTTYIDKRERDARKLMDRIERMISPRATDARKTPESAPSDMGRMALEPEPPAPDAMPSHQKTRA